LYIAEKSMSKHPYQDLIIQGSKAPSDPPKNSVKVSFSNEMIKEYIPIWQTIQAPKGIKLLALIMAQKEGFYIDSKGIPSRSYRTKNPANIGNVDSGKNKGFNTLKDGIEYQINFLRNIANGTNKLYPIGKDVFLKPYYSPEIAKNQKTYKLEPYCPGYKFKYTGQLDQFIKIYSTGARQKNTYLSLIISYFNNMGIKITEETTLKELIELK